MVDLLKELEAVTAGLDECTDEVAESQYKALRFLRARHAEIAAAVKDAERWRALHWAEAPMVTVTGSQLARGIRPGDFAVPWDWPVTSKTRIRMIVMNNSAREAGNEEASL